MNRFLTFFIFLNTIFIVSCSSHTERIEEEMKPFVEEHFPHGKYAIVKTGSTLHLKLSASQVNGDSEQLMTLILGEFYRTFYVTSAEVESNTHLSVSLETDSMKWTTEKYDLFELGKIFELTP